jgi:hypothetical protein
MTKSSGVEAWLAAHPNYDVRKDAPVPAEGVVLFVGSDGRWVQNLGKAIAIRPPANMPVLVGSIINVDRFGTLTVQAKNLDKSR